MNGKKSELTPDQIEGINYYEQNRRMEEKYGTNVQGANKLQEDKGAEINRHHKVKNENKVKKNDLDEESVKLTFDNIYVKIVMVSAIVVILIGVFAFYIYPTYIQEHPIEAIEIENLNTEMEVGEGYSFTYNIIPSNATNKDVEWEIRGLLGNVLEGATLTSDKSLIRISLDPAMFFDGDKINLVAINHASKVYQSATITVKSDFEFTPFKGVSKDISAGSTVEIDPKLPSSTSYKAEWSVKVSSEYLSYSVSGNILKLQVSSLAAKGDSFDISVKYGKYGPVNETITVSDGFVFEPFKNVKTFTLNAGDSLTISPELPGIQWEKDSSEIDLITEGDDAKISVSALASNKGFSITASYGSYSQSKTFKVVPISFNINFDTSEFVGYESFKASLISSKSLPSDVSVEWTVSKYLSIDEQKTNYAYITVSDTCLDGAKTSIKAIISDQHLSLPIEKEVTLIGADQRFHNVDSDTFVQKIKNRPDLSYKLVSDIVFKTWSPFPFNGTLDGNSKTITYSISGSLPKSNSDCYAGLFTTMYDASIYDLNISCEINVTNQSGSYTQNIGGLAGSISSCVFSNIVISGVINTDNEERDLRNNVGSISGFMSGETNLFTSITSQVSFSIWGFHTNVGGMVGMTKTGSSTFINCNFSSSIFGRGACGLDGWSRSGDSQVGGIIGDVEGGSVVLTQCTFNGTELYAQATHPYASGLIGYESGKYVIKGSDSDYKKDTLYEAGYNQSKTLKSNRWVQPDKYNN